MNVKFPFGVMAFLSLPSYLIFTVLLLLFLSLCKRLFEYFNFRRKISKLPGPRGNFVLGNSLEMRLEQSEILPKLQSWWKEYESEGLFCIHFPHATYVILTTPDNIQKILSSSQHLDKADIYRYLHPWLGINLLTSAGAKWKSKRKLLTPTFHFKILEDFIEIFNKHSETLVNKLSTEADGRTFDIFPFITLCALDIICETAMGSRQINAQENKDSEYVTALYKISRIVQLRTMNPLYDNDFIFSFTPDGRDHAKCLKILHQFTKKVIAERKAEMKADVSSNIEKKKRRMAFLDLLLKTATEGSGLSDEDIRAEVDTFMFEGHDTTSSGIAWTLYLLGLHPEIQNKVFMELKNVFGDENRFITTEDLQNLKYLECVIKESMRVYPPVPVFSRQLFEDFEMGKYKIPSGCIINIMPYFIHKNPDVFPNPDVFDPDRFLPENAIGRHPFAFIPFSAGPRNCIGQKFALMEEKVMLSHVLRSYRIESVDSPDKMKILSELILRPENGFLMKFYKRK